MDMQVAISLDVDDVLSEATDALSLSYRYCYQRVMENSSTSNQRIGD